MIISIASGKGGTGKTIVATNLAYVLAQKMRVAYVDCDVEEPNGHLFLNPEITSEKVVSVLVPNVDLNKCNFCSKCSELCQYNAIMPIAKTVLVFHELCHSCGGCKLVCPQNAIEEVPRPVGRLRFGRTDNIEFVEGRLNVGEAAPVPMTRATRQAAPNADVIIVDAPPGTSCPVISSVRGADVVVMVSDQTPFGLHDLKLAVDTIKTLGLPFGVVINRDGLGDERTQKYCESEDIPILAKIPDSRKIAEAYANGELAAQTVEGYAEIMKSLYSRIEELF